MELEKLSQQSSLIHGFSERRAGDCNPVKPSNKKNISQFLASLGLKRENLISMEQVHSNRVKMVERKNRGMIIPGIDGLVTREKGAILGVRSADCLPILFYDPVKKVIAVVHAGWRGVLKRLPQRMIDLMIKLGVLPENVMVGIGPHIGGCCYNINAQRAGKFKKEFGELEGMINKRKKGFHLDLMVPTITQLVHSGVLKKNIEVSSVCTSCRNQNFFSYRRDKKETYGEMLGVISLV